MCLRAFAMGALCAFVLLSGSSDASSAADANPMTAIMLVARPSVGDPYFAHSVVLVMNNLAAAPVGIIVNRPTSLAVAKLFPHRKRLAKLPAHLYFGGPVDLDTVWFLFRADRRPPHAVRAFRGVYLSADSRLLVRLLKRDKPMKGLRVFVGHAGWAPGQLQAEIGRGDWKLERAVPQAIFGGKMDRPWPDRRSPGHRI